MSGCPHLTNTNADDGYNPNSYCEPNYVLPPTLLIVFIVNQCILIFYFLFRFCDDLFHIFIYILF